MKRILGFVAAVSVSVAMVSPMFAGIAHFEGQQMQAQHNVRSSIIANEWSKVCEQGTANNADMYDLGGNMAGHND